MGTPNTISPFFRSPFTDITGGMVSHQLLGRCANEEMAMMDCMEAYGIDRGLMKCKTFIIDFHECHTTILQFKRFAALRDERDRQIKSGKLTGDKMYLSPRIDAY